MNTLAVKRRIVSRLKVFPLEGQDEILVKKYLPGRNDKRYKPKKFRPSGEKVKSNYFIRIYHLPNEFPVHFHVPVDYVRSKCDGKLHLWSMSIMERIWSDGIKNYCINFHLVSHNVSKSKKKYFSVKKSIVDGPILILQIHSNLSIVIIKNKPS